MASKSYLSSLFAFVITVTLSSSAHARPIPKLLNHFVDRISQVDKAFVQACAAEDANRAIYDSWELQSFYITITPSVNIGIPDVLNLSIQPELTLHWEKVQEDDWTYSE